jgi:hypothetical protein
MNSNEMSNIRNEEFDNLFQKVAISRFQTAYIDELESFYKKYEGQPDYKSLETRCKSLISLIYYKNDLPDKSFQIDLELLSKVSTEELIYSSIINRAINSSTAIGKTDGLRPYAESYLKTSPYGFYEKIFVLKWYVQHYSTNEDISLKEYESTLKSIASEMGTELDVSLSFHERLDFLLAEFRRANDHLHGLKVASLDVSKEQLASLLDEFLVNEPLAFFRNQALNQFK